MDFDREEILKRLNSDLGLSVRASNVLDAAGIETVRDLVRYSEADLLRLRAFGKTSLDEVTKWLGTFGLSPFMSDEDIRRWEKFGE